MVDSSDGKGDRKIGKLEIFDPKHRSLSFDPIPAECCSVNDELETTTQNSIYDYAVIYWAHHARTASNSDFMEWESAKKFLLHDVKMTAWLAKYANLTNSLVPQPSSDQVLHIAAYTGIIELVQRTLKIIPDVNVKDEDGRTALHWAAGTGYENIAELLLKSGANINAEPTLLWRSLLERERLGLMFMAQHH